MPSTTIVTTRMARRRLNRPGSSSGSSSGSTRTSVSSIVTPLARISAGNRRPTLVPGLLRLLQDEQPGRTEALAAHTGDQAAGGGTQTETVIGREQRPATAVGRRAVALHERRTRHRVARQ